MEKHAWLVRIVLVLAGLALVTAWLLYRGNQNNLVAESQVNTAYRALYFSEHLWSQLQQAEDDHAAYLQDASTQTFRRYRQDIQEAESALRELGLLMRTTPEGYGQIIQLRQHVWSYISELDASPDTRPLAQTQTDTRQTQMDAILRDLRAFQSVERRRLQQFQEQRNRSRHALWTTVQINAFANAGHAALHSVSDPG